MAKKHEEIRALCDVFDDMFVAKELRQFLTIYGYREVASAVSPNLGDTDYFFEVAQVLVRRGLIDDAFFDCLRRDRPKKEALIRDLQELWLVDEKPSPESSGSTSSSGPRELIHPEPPSLQHQSSVTTPRNIVVCCDGTDNAVAAESTNVLRLFCMLERDQRQVAYYDGGVGTLVDAAAISGVRKYLSRRLDAAIGFQIRENVIAAYRFLALNYQPGDRIYLFGFSRGAYTVRAVAGLIRFLGLLRPELENLAPLAWAIYANEGQAYEVSQRFAGGNRFNRNFGITPKPPIHFLGAWETVSSYGWFWDFRTLPHTAVNPSITHFRHALAIDERRAGFPAYLYVPREEQQPNCKQVWFAGVHADVGGGYREEEATLAKVPLAWMIREAEALGLLVNAAERQYLMDSKNKPPPDPFGPMHESLNGLWMPMEFLPRRSWNDKAKQMRWQRPNRGRRRRIEPGSVLHVSVLERMKQPGYSPDNLPSEYGVES